MTGMTGDLSPTVGGRFHRQQPEEGGRPRGQVGSQHVVDVHATLRIESVCMIIAFNFI